jgi:hypothetical protein
VGRALAAVGLALILCLTFLGLAVYLTRTEDRIAVDNLLAEDLSRAIGTAQADTGGEVELTRVANFPWQEVILVEAGTPRDAVSEELGFEWKGDLNFGVVPILIFMDNGRVERFADYRGEGVFEGFRTPFDRIPRSASTLRVRNLVITR